MNQRDQRRDARLTMDGARPIRDLLSVIGALEGLPLTGREIAEAYKSGLITIREGRLLQEYARRSPKARKRLASRGVTSADVDAAREKLERMSARLEAMRASYAPASTTRTRGGAPDERA